MITPDKEVLVVSNEDEKEYLTDRLILQDESIEQILQKHEKQKPKIKECLTKITNLTDAELIMDLYTDTEELLDAIQLLVCDLFSGRKISDMQILNEYANTLEYEFMLQLNIVCRRKEIQTE